MRRGPEAGAVAGVLQPPALPPTVSAAGRSGAAGVSLGLSPGSWGPVARAGRCGVWACSRSDRFRQGPHFAGEGADTLADVGGSDAQPLRLVRGSPCLSALRWSLRGGGGCPTWEGRGETRGGNGGRPLAVAGPWQVQLVGASCWGQGCPRWGWGWGSHLPALLYRCSQAQVQLGDTWRAEGRGWLYL